MDSQTLEQLKNIVARTEAKLDDWTEPIRGTAFLIAPDFALTCAHCLGTPGNKTWAENVTLYFSRWEKDSCTATVLNQPIWERDLAVLKLAKNAPAHARPMQLALNASPDIGWDTFAHPSPSENAGIRMSGIIYDPSAILPSSKSSFPLIQLRCFEGHQSIKGASGGPVVVNHRIIGMLNNQLCQEQAPDFYAPNSQRKYNPVYSVTYALSVDTMQEILREILPDILIDSAIPAPSGVRPSFSLWTPAFSKSRNRMHYWHEAVEFVGRKEELSKLLDFASPKQDRSLDFAWWLWTAPGGLGKSRLALHLCKELQKSGWRCGFLDSTTDFDQWEQWQVYQSTCIVIDHIAYRAKEISKAIRLLTQSTENIRAPLRLLLLERPFRPEDKWVKVFMPQAFPIETEKLFSCAYDPTEKSCADDLNNYEHQLGPLSDDDVWQIILTILNEEHKPIHPDRETTLKALDQIDPLRRPLFAIFTAEALCRTDLNHIRGWDRETLVKFVLNREFDLWKKTLGITDSEAELSMCEFEKHLNLVVFATIAGRHSAKIYKMLREEHSVSLPERILPDSLRVIAGYSIGDTDDAPPSLVPDILGELFVLERLAGNFGVDSNTQVPKEQTRSLLVVALAEKPRHTIDFIRRCVGDFPNHQSLKLFAEIEIPEGRSADVCLWIDHMVNMHQVAFILEAAEHGLELVNRCLSFLIDLSESLSVESELTDLFNSRLAIPYYNRAYIRYKLNDTIGAKKDCDHVVALIDAIKEPRKGVEYLGVLETLAQALRVRAVLLHQCGNIADALSDLERILTSQNVFEVTQGEALLVRARLYHDQRDDLSALRDYEQIIETNGEDLAELRQIAIDEAIPLLWKEGNIALKASDYESAQRYYNRLLKLSHGRDDLQAMVLLDIRDIYLQSKNPQTVQAVIEDCNAVLNTQDSPPDQQLNALLHRSQAYLILKQLDLAANDVKEVLGSISATARQRWAALLIRAQIRYGQGDKKACEDLLEITNQEGCDADLRQGAQQLLDQWGSR